MALMLLWCRADSGKLRRKAGRAQALSPPAVLFIPTSCSPILEHCPNNPPCPPRGSTFLSWALEREDHTKEGFSGLSFTHRAMPVLNTVI